MGWLFFSCVSAVAAAATAILTKIGVEGVPSTLATAIRTVIVAVLAWLVVFASGDARALGSLKMRPLGFLALSGVATAVSWLAYFRALQLGPASRVERVGRMENHRRRQSDDCGRAADDRVTVCLHGRSGNRRDR
jgi:transporter family protein